MIAGNQMVEVHKIHHQEQEELERNGNSLANQYVTIIDIYIYRLIA